jgi:site-specific DNA recombinase
LYSGEKNSMTTRRKSRVERHGNIRAAIYLRVSTEEQAKSGLGIAAQRDRTLSVLKLKDWEYIGEYADEGISGAKPAHDEKDPARVYRPALERLLTDCNDGKVDAVVFLSLDRLGRKTRLILKYVDDLASMGIQLVSCKENIDTSSAHGQLILTVFAAMAQLERDLASERTRAALTEAGKRTGDKGGWMPYGYRRQDDDVIVIEEEAEIVRLVYDWRKQGASMREIAFCLQDRGVAPRGSKWHHSAIQVILGNTKIYNGGRRDQSENYWPKILS